jgi:RNA polymerase sigma factor for flagellar operon FliA
MLHAPVQHDEFTYRRNPNPNGPDALVRKHRELVRKVAWHVHSGVSTRIELEDLVQIGLVALVEAARTFEDRGAAFAPYAAMRVRGAMIDHLRREAMMSRSGMANRRMLATTRAGLESRLSRRASDREMAEELGQSPEEYHSMVASAQPLERESIDEVYADDQPWFMDLGDRADTIIEREQLFSGMAAAIAELPEREAMVLQLYFVEELNLEEIGEILGIGATRICQIKKAALAKLKACFEARFE